jgi:DnaJ-class molecular chaperone
LKWHPDKNQKGEEEEALAKKMMLQINEAKDVLTNREKRDKYDQGFDLEEINSGRADHGFGGMGGGGIDPNDIFQMFAGMGGMGGGGGARRGGGGQHHHGHGGG